MALPEYVQFVGLAPPVGAGHGQRVTARLPVAWLEGDALAEYVRFLEEAATPRLPVAWLEGDALAEYVRFLEEAATRPQLPGVRWLEGDVLADFLQFHGAAEERREDECALHSGCGGGGNSDDGLMDDDEDGDLMDDDGEEELAWLLPHIMSLPAVMARAAAAAPPVQETVPFLSSPGG